MSEEEAGQQAHAPRCAHGAGEEGARSGGAGVGERRLSPATDAQDLLRRLRRIEGQVRGLQRMVEEGRYCVDILVQVAAVKAALDAVGLTLLDGHIRGCVQDAIVGGRGDDAVGELMDAIARYLRQP